MVEVRARRRAVLFVRDDPGDLQGRVLSQEKGAKHRAPSDSAAGRWEGEVMTLKEELVALLGALAAYALAIVMFGL